MWGPLNRGHLTRADQPSGVSLRDTHSEVLAQAGDTRDRGPLWWCWSGGVSSLDFGDCFMDGGGHII